MCHNIVKRFRARLPEKHTQEIMRKRSIICVIVFAVGSLWVLFIWAIWLLLGRGDSDSALTCAILLAPAYLLVSIRRHNGYSMRAFLATVLGILILVGTRNWPWGIDLFWSYVGLPPIAAFLVASTQEFVRRRKEAKGGPSQCAVCEYNLTGNLSGVCPECGTPVVCPSEE